jgi:NAD(P)-dependent dehydrogenase (short-subunit alcohol dehydrogenase family)
MGTNVLGTIYLTERLLPLLAKGAPSRVVVLSSEMATRAGALPLDDLGGEKLDSTSMGVYALSKLCDALYALALSRRHGGRGVLAASTHPGFVATEIQGKADLGAVMGTLILALGPLMACTPREGALSTLYAATAPDVKGACAPPRAWWRMTRVAPPRGC